LVVAEEQRGKRADVNQNQLILWNYEAFVIRRTANDRGHVGARPPIRVSQKPIRGA